MSRSSSRRPAEQPDFLPVVLDRGPALDLMTDVVIVGSSPGALCAAIACRQQGLEVLLIEQSGQLGFSSGDPDGKLWVPCGTDLDGDDYASARDYFDRVVGDFEPCSSAPRRHAFLTGTAALPAWLTWLGVALQPDPSSDYYPDVPGAVRQGRVLRPRSVDTTTIGQLAEFLADRSDPADGGIVDKLGKTARQVGQFASGRRRATGESALTAALLGVCQHMQVNIWWKSAVKELLTADEDRHSSACPRQRVIGVAVERGRRSVRVLAGYAVLLGEGGFGGNAALRREFLPFPSRTDWTIGPAAQQGAQQLQWAENMGLELAGMGYAWWRTGLWAPGVQTQDAGYSLARPHGFLVDHSGHRFTNEAARPADLCRALYARFNDCGPQSSFWLIIDSTHRKHYRLGNMDPGRLPRNAEKSGLVVSAETLPQLAWKIKVDAAGLESCAARFAHLCESGTDEDYHRGARTAERAMGDPKAGANPCLGAVENPPFYAVRVVPADVGTKGGLLTDEFCRAQTADGEALPGLWAIGSSASSVTGPTDPAPGTRLAEAMVGGRTAAQSIAASNYAVLNR